MAWPTVSFIDPRSIRPLACASSSKPDSDEFGHDQEPLARAPHGAIGGLLRILAAAFQFLVHQLNKAVLRRAYDCARTRA
jgi:hypothetical protein